MPGCRKEGLEQIQSRVRQQIDQAIETARSEPEPTVDDLTTEVFANELGVLRPVMKGAGVGQVPCRRGTEVHLPCNIQIRLNVPWSA